MKRTVLALVLLTTLPAVAGPAYYDGDDPNPAPLSYPEATLTATLQQELAKKKVTVKNAVTGETDVSKLSRTEKLGLLYAVGAKPGAEFDALVEEGGKFTPVETIWDGSVLSFKVGKPIAALYGKASSKEDIQKKYGVGPFVDKDATWDNDSLYIVEQALATLTKVELEGVAGLPFHRYVADPRNKQVRGTSLAMYVPDSSVIEFYSHGMGADKRKFFGSVDKPILLSVFAVVHECGHAIARKSARGSRGDAVAIKAEYDEINQKLMSEKKKYDEDKATYAKTKDPALRKSLEDRVPMFKQLQADMKEKQKLFEAAAKNLVAADKTGSPMETAFAAKLPVKESPTIYGRTSIAESFAESLALYKVDKPAIDRAAPGVSTWFESPAYATLITSK